MVILKEIGAFLLKGIIYLFIYKFFRIILPSIDFLTYYIPNKIILIFLYWFRGFDNVGIILNQLMAHSRSHKTQIATHLRSE